MSKQTGDTLYKPIVISYELDSGVRVDIKPMPLATQRLIREKAAEKFPLPDAKAYERTPEPGTTAHDGVVIPATEDEEYNRLHAEASEKQALFLHRRLLKHSINFPDFPNQQAVIEHFLPQLQSLADDDLLEIETDPDELWWQIYIHCILASSDDQVMIALASQSSLPITEGEEREALRIFRPNLQRSTLRRALRQSGSPGTT